MDGKTTYSTQCSKSCALTKVIYLFLGIKSFLQQCAIIKRVTEVRTTGKYMVTIGVDQYLSNSAMHQHKCLENIKNVYKSTGNVMTNNSKSPLLKQQWSPLLKDLITTFQYHLANL